MDKTLGIACTLGIGLTLDVEFQITRKFSLRPTRLDCDFRQLEGLADTQRTYGFLCSLAPHVTFELDVDGDTAREAVINAWNSQWVLVHLSIIGRHPLFGPFGRVGVL